MLVLLPRWDLGVGDVTRKGRRVGSLCKGAQRLQQSKQLELGAVVPIGPHGDERDGMASTLPVVPSLFQLSKDWILPVSKSSESVL